MRTQEEESERQEKNGRLVRNEVITCQSGLVDMLLAKEIFSYDDIINSDEPFEPRNTGRCKTCGAGSPDDKEDTPADLNEDGNCQSCFEPQPQEILEWWVVTTWMADKLKEQGEPILENEWGVWWGRTCSGQAILLDNVIDKIRESLDKA